MEPKDLIGKHKLSGVDMLSKSIEHYGSLENCQVINFVLDGKTYTATEDPSDGYRSSMESLIVSDYKTENNFKPIAVVGTMRNSERWSVNDVIEFIDIHTGKVVLAIGTGNVDDYYPSFIAEFTPENMVHNAGK